MAKYIVECGWTQDRIDLFKDDSRTIETDYLDEAADEFTNIFFQDLREDYEMSWDDFCYGDSECFRSIGHVDEYDEYDILVLEFENDDSFLSYHGVKDRFLDE